MLDITIQSLEDQGFRVSTSLDGEPIGSCVVSNRRQVKTRVLHTLFISWIEPNTEISIQGDYASEFVSEFIDDANGMMETLVIRHDL